MTVQKMKINRLILKNGFTYLELLKLKNQYRDKKNETYDKGVKTTDDESLKYYILLIADICGGNMISVSPVFIVMMFGAYFYGDGTTEVTVYLMLFILFILCYIWNRSRGIKLSFILTTKLVWLRLRMYLYRVSPPKTE